MKELRCRKCAMYLGEIEKGKIKKGVAILCVECIGIYESLANCNKNTNGKVGDTSSFTDLFGGLFGKK